MVSGKKIRRLLTFKDEIAGQKICWDIMSDLEFTDDVDSQMQDVVEGFMLSGALEARAEERYERLKIEIDEFRGYLSEQAVEDLVKVTDSSVKNWIERNQEYVKRRKKLARYGRQVKVLKHLNRAFQIKSELIRTKAANLRQQYNDLGMSPPTVGKKRRKDDGG